MPNTSPITFKAKLVPELAALERATARLQRAINAEQRSIHTRAILTGSSTFIPQTARNLRLLVVLWEASGIEQLMSSLTSVVGKCSSKINMGDCVICTEPFTRVEMVSVEGCGHTTCKGCLRKHIGTRLGERVWPVLCPICMTEGGSQRKAQGILIPLMRSRAIFSDAF